MNTNKQFERGSNSPKFIRRSISPIQYINTEEYKKKIRSNHIQLNFGFISQKKIEKVSISKRSLNNSKLIPQKPGNILLDKTQAPEPSSQVSFVKNSEFSSSLKSIGKNMSEQGLDSQILKNIDSDSELVQGEIDIEGQLYRAHKKIFEIESELQIKNNKIGQKQQTINLLEQRNSQSQKKIKIYQRQLQKIKISLAMEQRKGYHQQKLIKKLRALNMANMTNMANMETTQRILRRVDHHKASEQQITFQLSPEKQ